MYGQNGAGGMGASGGARQESPDQAQGNPVGMVHHLLVAILVFNAV